MKRYYAVIDTNVIVSALMTKNQHSPTVKLLDFVVAKTVVPVYNDDILEEYKDVLSRAKFHFDTERIDAVLETMKMTEKPFTRRDAAEFVGRIILKKKFVDGVDDDAVFMVGGIEDEESSFAIVQYGSVGRGKIVFFVEK